MAWVDNFKRYDTSNGYGNSRKWQKAFYARMSDDEAIKILEDQEQTPYSILGVSESSTQAEIKKAFLLLIKEWHPDYNSHKVDEANEMSKKIIAAYTFLKTKN